MIAAMAKRTPFPSKPFNWNKLPFPELIAWPIYPEDSPARKDEESEHAFNEEAARAAFGDSCADWLTTTQPRFRGDWWSLAMLLRCEANARRPDQAEIGPDHFDTLSRFNTSLRRAGLWLHLEYAELSSNKLTRINLDGSVLRFVNFSYTKLQHSEFILADLQHATMTGAYLNKATFRNATLTQANLNFAQATRVDYTFANLTHVSVTFANLSHARFFRTNLNGTMLEKATLNYALTREATGILFNDNAVQGMDIEGNAKDPWSVLRRKYTGPMFFVHLLLLVAFVLPYAAKVLALTVTGRTYEAMRVSLESGIEAPAGADVVQAWLERFDAAHTQTHAWWALLGGTQGLWWLFVPTALAILLYNILRGYLTLRVGILRDQADRVLRTPTLEEYYGPCHPLARNDARWPRLWPVWKRNAARWWKAEESDHRMCRRVANMAMLSPLGVLGLYRLHQIARVLFWISLASVSFHVGAWLLTTTVPVPK